MFFLASSVSASRRPTGKRRAPVCRHPTSERRSTLSLQHCREIRIAGLRRPPDKDDDIIGADGCRPVPSRFVVLGDSIARCYGLGTGDVCSSKAIAAEIKNQFSPDLVFESHAMDGFGVMDLPGQAAEVAPGSGHVYVWIFAVGNDLASGLVLGGDLTPYQSALSMVFDYFSSEDRFPDGATFLLNGQYALYDRCDVPGSVPGYTPALADRLREVNKVLFFDSATARSGPGEPISPS